MKLRHDISIFLATALLFASINANSDTIDDVFHIPNLGILFVGFASMVGARLILMFFKKNTLNILTFAISVPAISFVLFTLGTYLKKWFEVTGSPETSFVAGYVVWLFASFVFGYKYLVLMFFTLGMGRFFI